MTRYRWTVCALIFAATTVNYIDRQVLALLEPILKDQFGWTKFQYGEINAAFQIAYALGMVSLGGLFDRWGTRISYALVMGVWSVAAAAHAAAASAFGFGVARFSLGLGESGNFPVAIKSVAEWFPKRERALATGIFNAGTNTGAILAPLGVPFLVAWWGWRAAFIATGLIGFVWLLFWLRMYGSPKAHPRVSPSERDLIESDHEPEVENAPWLPLFAKRETWAIVVGKFLTDPIWWFYLTWLPPLLHDRFGLDLKTFGPPVAAVYLVADGGSIAGGWLSSWLLKKTGDVNRARKTAMLVCALCVLPVAIADSVQSVWIAIAVISLAAAAHQGWSANLFTLASDLFPQRSVASVVGIGGMAGAIGGTIFQLIVGACASYVVPFVVAACAYLLGLLFIHLLSPKFKSTAAA